MQFPAGKTLGPYTIVSPLGAGGMGEVYRARDSRIGRDVAIKVLPESLARDREGLARFEREAKAAGMLNHPNLLTIYEFGTEDGLPYMVAELLEGESLRDRLTRHPPLHRRDTIRIALQIASGLAAAHEKAIVHRDLKPENIFVMTDDGRVKILDFGLAKHHPIFGQEGGLTAAHATEPGVVLGTVGYMSPEQVRGEQLDQRSDIFSFGAILYELLCGQRAFKRETSVETLSAILREEPPDLAELDQQISPVLEKIVRRCLEKNRQLRFQSARDLAFHLESLPPATASGHSQAGIAPAPVASPPEPRAAAPTRSMESIGPAASQPAQPQGEGSQAAHPSAPSEPTARSMNSSIPRSSSLTAHSAVKPRPFPQQYPVRKPTPPVKLLLLAFAFLSVGAVGGVLFQQRQSAGTVPSFQRMTFRRGDLYSARFARDGDTIVYAAAWDGGPPELYMMRRQSPESRAFGLIHADIAAISDQGELAVLTNRDRTTRLGTLARLPLVGGTPRKIMDDVLNAEFLPGGQDLAVIRKLGDRYRLEVPLGNLVLESARRIDRLRISSNGKRVAFVQPSQGGHEILMIEDGQPEVLTSGWRHGVTGLAWSADGRELWFTATDSGVIPPSLFAVTPGREPRLVARLTGSLSLQDISPQGRVLFSHTDWRSSLWYVNEPEGVEADLAWLDWSTLRDLSRDGRWLLFSETREGGGGSGSVYLRDTRAASPVRLGSGFGESISPDGQWVLAHASRNELIRLPTGTGEAETIATIDASDQGVLWFPDGKRILIAGSHQGSGYRLFVQDLLTREIRPLTPEGIWGADAAYRPWAISHDGRIVAAMSPERRLTLYPVDGSRAIPVRAAAPEQVPIQWSEDGAAIFVYDPSQLPARIHRIDLMLETSELWKEFTPADPAGVYKISPVLMTPAGDVYSYNSLRSLSDLYVGEQLE